jgi:glutamate racemase
VNGPIGVFDSGVGGLTVVRAILERLPRESIIYFGDTARVPYGTKSKDTIVKFALEDARFLLSRGVKVIVVACNSVSSNALDVLKSSFEIPIIGVIDTVARAASRSTRNRKLGVIGTRATVESRAYERAILASNPDVQVRSVSCPLFVPLAEEGWLDSEITRLVAREYLSPLIGWGIDTLLLGCTHYPLLKNAIGEVVGQGVSLIDSGEATAGELADLLTDEGMLAGGDDEAEHQFFLSDLPRNFADIGSRFLGREIGPVHTADVAEQFSDLKRS